MTARSLDMVLENHGDQRLAIDLVAIDRRGGQRAVLSGVGQEVQDLEAEAHDPEVLALEALAPGARDRAAR